MSNKVIEVEYFGLDSLSRITYKDADNVFYKEISKYNRDILNPTNIYKCGCDLESNPRMKMSNEIKVLV